METDTIGIFGQVEFPVRDDLSLTVGGRWTDVERDFFYQTNGFGAAPELLAGISSNFSDSDYSARLALDWHVNNDTLVYGSISRGFNAGTFNSQFLATVENTLPTNSESMVAYEVGVKSTLAGGRANFEAAVYHYEFSDPQVVAVEPLSNISANFLINADDATLTGAELQFRVLPTDWLDFNLGVAYIDSEYGSLITSVGGTGTGSPFPYDAPIFGSTAVQLAGNQFPNHPELSINSSARVTFAVNDSWNFAGNLDFLWEDDIPRDLLGARALFTESHIDVDLRLALQSTDDMWDAAIWVRNLTDETYLTEAYEVLGFGFFIAAGNYNYPRTYGIDLTRRF